MDLKFDKDRLMNGIGFDGRPRYYDKTGKPLGLFEWGKLFEDFDYKVIKQEYTKNKKYWISTVWLGLDHSFTGGTPLIFETMVFRNRWKWSKGAFGMKPFKYRPEVDMQRYSTLIGAKRGHTQMMGKYEKN